MDPTTRRQALARLKRSAAKAARSRETADRDEADRTPPRCPRHGAMIPDPEVPA